MGLGRRIRTAIGGMTTPQKIVTVAVALLVPLGIWLGLLHGQVPTIGDYEYLATAEISALVAALCAIFGITPPTQ